MWLFIEDFAQYGDREMGIQEHKDYAHEVVFFQRHHQDDPEQQIPGRDALNSWPAGIRAKARAVISAVAAAPPMRFAGGGYWEAMKGDMAGWFEIRINGPQRHHYRLYCKLDYAALGIDKPLLVIIDGRDKPFRASLSPQEYNKIQILGNEYLRRNPRSLA